MKGKWASQQKDVNVIYNFEAEEDILKCCYSQNNWIILTQTAASYIWHLYSDHWDYV